VFFFQAEDGIRVLTVTGVRRVLFRSIMIAVAIGIAMRRLAPERFQLASQIVETAFDVLLVMLHWVIELIPLAVFGIVASIVATRSEERRGGKERWSGRAGEHGQEEKH